MAIGSNHVVYSPGCRTTRFSLDNRAIYLIFGPILCLISSTYDLQVPFTRPSQSFHVARILLAAHQGYNIPIDILDTHAGIHS